MVPLRCNPAASSAAHLWVQGGQQGELDDGDVGLGVGQHERDEGSVVEAALGILAALHAHALLGGQGEAGEACLGLRATRTENGTHA